MFSFRTVLLFLIALIAFVGSTNGDPSCDDLSAARQEMYDQQAQRSAESADRMGRITLDCQTTGGSGGAHNGTKTIIELFVGLFFLICVAIGIWFFCVRRQKTMNAAAIKPYSGEVGAKEMGNVMDEKTKTVAMSTTATGKLSKW